MLAACAPYAVSCNAHLSDRRAGSRTNTRPPRICAREPLGISRTCLDHSLTFARSHAAARRRKATCCSRLGGDSTRAESVGVVRTYSAWDSPMPTSHVTSWSRPMEHRRANQTECRHRFERAARLSCLCPLSPSTRPMQLSRRPRRRQYCNSGARGGAQTRRLSRPYLAAPTRAPRRWY